MKYLIKNNFFVINVDKVTYSANSYNLKNINKKNYTFFKVDINNKKKMINIFNKYKPIAVFNLAAETHVDRSIDSPKSFIYSNILGVYNLLEAIKNFNYNKNKKIKLIHVSTDEVYGDIDNFKIRSSEGFPYLPSSPYSASKASADHLVKAYVRTYKVPAVISNCCNNYGPGQFPEKLIPKVISKILKNKYLPIYGAGKNSREWIHVEDHCKALLLLLKKGKTGQSYNVGSNENLSNINLVRKILLIIKNKGIYIGNKVKIKYVMDRPGHDLRYALNSKKIFNSLGWKSKININEGLSKTVDWYLQNKQFFKKIPKKNYDKRFGLKIK